MKDITTLFVTSPITLVHFLVVLALIPYAAVEADEQYGQPWGGIFTVTQSVLLILSLVSMV